MMRPLTASGAERGDDTHPEKAHRSVLHGWPKQAMLGNSWEVVWERLGHQGGSLGKGTELQELESGGKTDKLRWA